MPRSARPAAPPRTSLFRSGAGPRLGLAVALSGLVWLTIAWALAA